MNALLEVNGLTKQFVKDDVGILALRDLSLSVQEGSFVTVLGRS